MFLFHKYFHKSLRNLNYIAILHPIVEEQNYNYLPFPRSAAPWFLIIPLIAQKQNLLSFKWLLKDSFRNHIYLEQLFHWSPQKPMEGEASLILQMAVLKSVVFCPFIKRAPFTIYHWVIFNFSLKKTTLIKAWLDE